MARLVEITNPFDPLGSLRIQEVSNGLTVKEAILSVRESLDFTHPTICVVDGAPLLRAEWETTRVQEDTIINLIVLPADPITTIIVSLVLVVAAIAVSFLLMPTVPKETAPDPVYSIRGQYNAIRLGEPIEVCYGRNRLYPSLASRPYYLYEGNQQYQFSLYCLGQGEFVIHEIRFGDSSIESFDEVQYQVCPPGTMPTLFPFFVFASQEVGGLTLYAPNQPEYQTTEWAGPFVAAPPGRTIDKIGLDFVFPRGLYSLSRKGKRRSVAIQIRPEWRQIDNAGNPIGPWTSPGNITFQASSTSPQRFTKEFTVSPARYEVRCKRITNWQNSPRVGEEVQWDGLKGYMVQTEPHNFGNVTLLAVKVRATANLNERSYLSLNVIATRVLPIRVGGTWTTGPTRSIVWAFADLLRSNYGGMLADQFLDLAQMEQLDAVYTSRGDRFDWVFRDRTTLWEAAKTILRVGRAVPIIKGTRISLKRDAPATTPVTIFTDETIVRGTFEWSIKLWEQGEHDALRVEYTDPDFGYKQEDVLCVLPGGTSNNPKHLRFEGIQSRAQAYREGLYLLARERYLRESVTFETGLEGFIPGYLDLVGVTCRIPNWSTGGFVIDAQNLGGGKWLLTVSQPLLDMPGTQGYILFRNRNGSVAGPYNAVPKLEPHKIEVTIPTITLPDMGFEEPLIYSYGSALPATRLMRVIKIEPQGSKRVKITCVPDDSRIYSFDSLPVPGRSVPFTPPPTTDAPVVERLTLTQLDSTDLQVQASWSSATGASVYLVQTSEGNNVWSEGIRTTVTSIVLPAWPGTFYFRVAGIGRIQGPWKTGQINVSFVTGLRISQPWTGTSWAVDWNSLLDIHQWKVQVYDNTVSPPVLKREINQSGSMSDYSYNFSMAQADNNLKRKMRVMIDAILLDLETNLPDPLDAPVGLDLENAPPPAPTSLGYYYLGEETAGFRYQLFWTNPTGLTDLYKLKVWVADFSGFNPILFEPDLNYTRPQPGPDLPNTHEIVIPRNNGGHNARYWRVAVFDCWGDEIGNNISSEQVIPAGP